MADAAELLRSLAGRPRAEAAATVRDRILTAASPSTEAEALARAAAARPSWDRGTALTGIVQALVARSLGIGPHACALAVDPLVLGEARDAGLDDRGLEELVARASPEAAAAHRSARAVCLDVVGADRARRRAEHEAIHAAEIAPRRDPGTLAPDAVWNWAVDEATLRLATVPIAWWRSDDFEFPYLAEHEGHALAIRLNDFPEAPLYSLLRDGKVVGDLEDWPKPWGQYGSPPAHAAALLDPKKGRA